MQNGRGTVLVSGIVVHETSLLCCRLWVVFYHSESESERAAVLLHPVRIFINPESEFKSSSKCWNWSRLCQCYSSLWRPPAFTSTQGDCKTCDNTTSEENKIKQLLENGYRWSLNIQYLYRKAGESYRDVLKKCEKRLEYPLIATRGDVINKHWLNISQTPAKASIGRVIFEDSLWCKTGVDHFWQTLEECTEMPFCCPLRAQFGQAL